jgi:two-component system response regulator DesR
VIRVLVAEDQHMIRGALVALIGLESDLEVVAEVDRGDMVEAAAARTRPDVAVIDIDLPGLDGISAAHRLRTSLPACQVLVVTGLAKPSHLLRALRGSVRGFLPKHAPATELIDGIRRVAAGERVLDPVLVAAAVETGASPLTIRETDVLRAAATGLSTDQIAVELLLSHATVRNYLSNAMSKLEARNRIDAIRIATDAGWL